MEKTEYHNTDREKEEYDSELLMRIKEGDIVAFTALYKKYSAGIYTFCTNLTKSRQDAQDMVQEIFVKLWDSRQKLSPDASARGFLFVLAKNMLIDAYRKRVNDPVYEDYIEYSNSLGSEDESRIEYQEFLTIVKSQIDTLPPAQRRVMNLSKIENLSIKEIAERLNVSQQTVMNQSSQGLKHLREKLRRYLNGSLIILLLFAKYLLEETIDV